MKWLKQSERSASPWKNAGGVTWQVAIEPSGAGLDDFDWRISMAEVSRDGRFSRFDGVDRTLLLLEGRSLTLEFPTRRVVLERGSAAVAFAGEVPVSASPDGRVLDFGVMSRRGRFCQRVERLVLNAAVSSSCREGVWLVVNVGAGTVQVDIGAESGMLDYLDAALWEVEDGDSYRLTPGDVGAEVVLVCLSNSPDWPG